MVAGCVSNPEVKFEADTSRGGAPSAAGAEVETGIAAPEFDLTKAKNLSTRLRSASGASKLMGPRSGMFEVPFTFFLRRRFIYEL